MRVDRRHLLFCAPMLLLILVSPARADFEAGKRAYERGDYSVALKELRPLAEQGNAEAQALLGLMYNLGRGVPLDSSQALKWYKAAAEQGGKRARLRVPLSGLVCLSPPTCLAADTPPHWVASERSVCCLCWFATRSAGRKT